jgi:adenylylsulfate kinase-like enzyme
LAGIDDTCEASPKPELAVDSGAKSAEQLAEEVVAHLDSIAALSA